MWAMLSLEMTLELIAGYARLVVLFAMMYLPFWRIGF